MLEINIDSSLKKAERYQSLIPQLESLFLDEKDLIANMANLCAVLKSEFSFFWVGFYFNRKEELVLGPFQGPLACTRISLGKGVCGKAASDKKTIVVDDVNAFPGHIACSAESNSEIVIPVVKNNSTIFVLDVDSEHLSNFDNTDKEYLEAICALLTKSSETKHLL